MENLNDDQLNSEPANDDQLKSEPSNDDHLNSEPSNDDQLNSEMSSDDQLKIELSFDLYSRYAIARDIININRDAGKRLRILDVGGRGNLMQKFMPEDEVFYIDPYVESDDESHLEGDGCDIPQEDNSFDYVVSSDVLEHIEPSKRGIFLSENLRVAKSGVILGAPFYSRERELAEIYANESYRTISRGEDHFWLKEHIDNGLPDNRELEELLRTKEYEFQKIHNNNLVLWEHLLCSSFVFLAAGKLEKTREFNQYYNEKIYPSDHGEDSYRTIYFIKKAKGLKDLELKDGGIETGLQLEAVKNNFALLSQVYLEEKDEVERLKTELGDNKILVIRKEMEIEDRRWQHEAAIQEIERIRATFSWRITRPLRFIRIAMGRLATLARNKR